MLLFFFATQCVTCEKKIVVPVQLCVLSTGFVQLSPQMSPICSSFPQLFPDQVDEESQCRCGCEENAESEDLTTSTTSAD